MHRRVIWAATCLAAAALLPACGQGEKEQKNTGKPPMVIEYELDGEAFRQGRSLALLYGKRGPQGSKSDVQVAEGLIVKDVCVELIRDFFDLVRIDRDVSGYTMSMDRYIIHK